MKRHHTFRVDDDLWSAAVAEAEARGETVTDAVLRMLRRYSRHTLHAVKADPQG